MKNPPTQAFIVVICPSDANIFGNTCMPMSNAIIASCQTWKQCKYFVNLHTDPLRPLEPKDIFGRWSMDILQLPESKEGYRYILMCVESLTRWPEAIPPKDQSASTIVQALYREVFTRYGPPKTLLSDRGPNLSICKTV